MPEKKDTFKLPHPDNLGVGPDKFIMEIENIIRSGQFSADQHDYFKDGFVALRKALDVVMTKQS